VSEPDDAEHDVSEAQQDTDEGIRIIEQVHGRVFTPIPDDGLSR
jgi:hypothetical protein